MPGEASSTFKDSITLFVVTFAMVWADVWHGFYPAILVPQEVPRIPASRYTGQLTLLWL